MSNRLTFSLASLILIFAFVAIPTIAHDVDTATDGQQHATGGTDIGPHTHNDRPTVSSVELVNVLVGTTNTVHGDAVVLVDSVSAPTAVADGTAAGQFLVKITFNEDVYDGTPTTLPDGMTPGSLTAAAADDLEATELDVIAAEIDKTALNLFGTGSITISAVQHQVVGATIPTITAAITADTQDLKVFWVTFAVADTLFGGQTGDTADSDIDIWVGVDENAVYNRTKLVGPVTNYGSGNTLEGRAQNQFRIVQTLDTTAPELTITHAPADRVALPTSGMVTFTIVSDELLASGSALEDSEITITNGTGMVSAGVVGTNMVTYTLPVTPTDPTMDVTVAIAAGAVADAAGNMSAAVAVSPDSTYIPADSIRPTVEVEAPNDNQLNAMGDAVFTITFSEALATSPVSGFSFGDLTVTGGMAEASDLEGPNPAGSNPQGNEQIYWLSVTPDGDGTIMVTVGDAIEDAAGNQIDLTHADSTPSASMIVDMTSPDVVAYRTMILENAPANAPAMGDYVAFTFTFTEAIDIDTFTVNSIDQGSSHNIGRLSGNYFGPTDVSGMAIDPIDATTVYADHSYQIIVPISDTEEDTTIVLKVGSGAIEDMFGNSLASSYAASHLPDNTAPVFVDPAPDDLTLCQDEELLDQELTNKGVLLPKARDSEGDTLVYSLHVYSGTRVDAVTTEIPNLERDEAPTTGLYWVTIDSETRYLRGKAEVSDGPGDGITYEWRVTDQHGVRNTDKDLQKFKIKVTPYQKPMKVTEVTARKLNSIATIGDDKDRVILTWTDPNLKEYPNAACIPLVEKYTVTRQKLSSHILGRKVLETVTRDIAATDAGDPPEYVTNVGELETGTYQFTITATNDGGTSDASDRAKWDKTGSYWIIVDDPPKAAQNLSAAEPPEGPMDKVTLDWIPPESSPNAPVNDAGYAMELYGVGKPLGGYHIEVTSEKDAKISYYPKGYDEDNPATFLRGDNRTFQIDDLSVGEYTVRVVAHNVVGMGPLSNVDRFEIAVPPTPTKPTTPETPNQPPHFVVDNASIDSIEATINVQIRGRFLPAASDPDGDELEYSIDPDLPKGLDFDTDNRALTGTPEEEMKETPYTYTVSDGEAEITLGFFITVSDTPAGPPAQINVVTTVPDKGYVVFVRDTSNPPHFGTSKPNAAAWADMPNLYQLFREGGGGSLQLNVMGKTARQVVFSEVMWAVDESKVGQDSYTGKQWIELHNRSGSSINISDISFVTKSGRPALAQGTDLISNVVGRGEDWIKDGKGQNGNSAAGSLKEFISMYRNNYGEAGWASNRWSQSTLVYHPNHKGTPGVGEPRGPVVIGTDSVTPGPIIFNEISNNRNPDHEWIELRNVSGGNQNLKNWEVTMLTSKGANQSSHNDVDLIDFTTADRNVPAGGVVLIVKSDPTGDESHPLAGGWNFGATGAWAPAGPGQANYVPGVNGDSPRYIVAHSFGNMPDEGNFVLVLRNRQDRNGSTGDGNIRDIAGYVPDSGLKVETGDKFTHLWPLSNFGAPNRANNNLVAGTVQYRQHAHIDGTKSTENNNNNDKVAFRDDNNGWTGIGYKRNATPNAQNGGTPGYPHGVLRSNDNDANSAVIISEIMPTKGERNLPEWIELRNVSRTIGVSVDNWRLTITNHDSTGAEGTYDGDLIHTIPLSGRIPPGQTYLIVARNGRNQTNLPSQRVKNVGRSRTQHLINPYGFEIKLESKKDNNFLNVDTVGNLGEAEGRRSRSFAPIMWEWPASMDESGDRISIVRASISGSPVDDGTTRMAWRSFEVARQPDEVTFYGHQSDFGSPGHTAGGVLPVSLSAFRADRLATDEIVIRWTTESETNNAGFNILRSDSRDGEFTKLNTQLIAGQGTTSERSVYKFTDTSAKPNVVYYYQIQDVSFDGDIATLRTSRLRGHVSPGGKATTTWGELKALQ